MTLKSKSFLVPKGSSLDDLNSFIEKEIGYNSFLIRSIESVVVNEGVTQVTLLYNKYTSTVVDSVAPREGAVFTTDLATNDFDIRFLFSEPIDYQSVVEGTFKIDDVSLPLNQVNLDYNSNNYYLKISASGIGYQTQDFHTYQISNTLKRKDGSQFSYTPVGGYVFHTLSNAHIGDIGSNYYDRRRGKTVVAVLRLSKGINPQQGIIEYLSQKQLAEDRLISYTTCSRHDNLIDIYFIYLSRLEPQIVSGFPLNNSLLPDVSAPSKITFVFNTKLDANTLANTSGLFTIESGFNTSVNVSPGHITLLSDLKTVQIDTTTYFTNQKVYSVIARPGIKSIEGVAKEKPEQWTIHISAYDPGVGGVTGGAPTSAAYILAQTDPDLDNAYVLQSSTGIVITTGGGGIQIGGRLGTTTTYGVAKFSGNQFTMVNDHVTVNEAGINHVNLAGLASDSHTQYLTTTRANTWFSNTAIYFNGVTGGVVGGNIYLSGVGINEHLTNTSNPHSTTVAQIGAVGYAEYLNLSGQVHSTINSVSGQLTTTINNVSGQLSNATSYLSGQHATHTGQTSIHFTQAQISIISDQVSDFDSAVLAIAPGGSALTGGTGIYVVTGAVNTVHLSGDFYTGVTGHIGNTGIHHAIADLNSIYQPLAASLTAYAGLATSSGSYLYFTGADKPVTGSLSTYMRTLLDDPSASIARQTLLINEPSNLGVLEDGTSLGDLAYWDTLGGGSWVIIDSSAAVSGNVLTWTEAGLRWLDPLP